MRNTEDKLIKGLTTICVSSILIVGGGAFALSFAGLRAVAEDNGVGALSWLWPIILDVAIIGFALNALRASLLGFSTHYMMFLVVCVTGASIFFNGYHAECPEGSTIRELQWWVPKIIWGLPPFCLFLATELMIRQFRREQQAMAARAKKAREEEIRKIDTPTPAVETAVETVLPPEPLAHPAEEVPRPQPPRDPNPPKRADHVPLFTEQSNRDKHNTFLAEKKAEAGIPSSDSDSEPENRQRVEKEDGPVGFANMLGTAGIGDLSDLDLDQSPAPEDEFRDRPRGKRKPSGHREVISLFEKGLPYPTIAKRTGYPTNHVKTILSDKGLIPSGEEVETSKS